MGGVANSYSPQASGYNPVQVSEKDGQYYQRPKNSLNHRNPTDTLKSVLPFPGNTKGSVEPMSYAPVNFGGGGQQLGGRYGAPRKYGTPRSTYRAPATYSNRPTPSYGGGQTSKGTTEAPPPSSYQQPYNKPKFTYQARVPSFDPKNPQEDAIKDPKLREAAEDLNEQAPPGERLAFINPEEESVLKALGGSGMTAAGGIPSYKKGDVEPPPPRDYGQETADTLQAQVDLAPELFESEAQFRPQYANLERGIMLEQMGIDPQMGLLDAFRTISGAQKDIQRDSTLADINMIGGLGQQFADAVRSADPRAEGLRQSIMGEAEQGLEEGAGEFSEMADQAREDYLSGEGLTALEKRDIDQQILEGAASRGMEGQASTLQDQVAGRLSADRSVRDQRRDVFERALANESTAQQQSLQNAGTAYSMGNFDPLLALTGRSGNAPVMAQQGFGGANFALNSSPGIFNPESAYAGSLATSNQQNIMDARTATAANSAGMMQGLMGMGGSIIGGGMGKGGAFNFR